jgi:D-alanyl-D-alanine carboxypeptidase (penicillin-binding protein 5/6)
MPLSQRQVYRRRRIVVGLAATLVLGTGIYLPLTLLAPLHAITADVHQPAELVPSTPVVTLPGYGASGVGAIGYPGVLASAGSTTALPIASISKVITALVVLDAKPLAPGELGPNLTFTETDEDFMYAQRAIGGVTKPVRAGQVMSQRTVMDVMLMASANNYAESLASWAFGSEAAFAEAARAWLDREGLVNTTIEEPTGVSPNNASTVPDLVEIARKVVEHPVLAEIVATQSLDVPGVGLVENRNGLLGVDGIDGIKTGTLDEAGACLLFSQDVTVGTTVVTVVGVVLGGPDHATINAAIRQLLAEVDAGFSEVTLTTEGQAYGEYTTPWGDDATAVSAESATMVLWAATPVNLDVRVDEVTLADAGTTVGELRFTAGENVITVPLELSATIDDPGPWWRLANPVELF